jgi:hypothetical protein
MEAAALPTEAASPERINPVQDYDYPEIPEDMVTDIAEVEENPSAIVKEVFGILIGAAVAFLIFGYINSYIVGAKPASLDMNLYTGLIFAGEVVVGGIVLYYGTKRGSVPGRSDMMKKVVQGAATGIMLAGAGTFFTQILGGTNAASPARRRIFPATSIPNVPPNFQSGGIVRRNRAVAV